MREEYNFFDFESFGANARIDRPSQFASIRTDIEFNEIGDPTVLYCRPADDFLPSIEACLITGITPQIALEKGLPENEFFRLIHQEMMRPRTCNLGFNSINFDDELIRHGLYRNFFDPYEREYKHGNSRFDILNVIRAVYALRPEGVQWPVNAEGRVELRLERLTQANGIEHKGAHDALSDVRATIAVAKMIKKSQLRLFEHFLSLRNKTTASNMLEIGKPILHVSPFFSAERNYLSVVIPLFRNTANANSVIAYDLNINPEDFLNWSPEEIRKSLFSKKTEREIKIPLVEIHVNKCPILAPISVIRPQDAKRLGFDSDLLRRHSVKLQEAFPAFAKNVALAYAGNSYGEPETDPDLMLYSGGFFDHSDKQLFFLIRQASEDELASMPIADDDFHDPRGPTMLFRYRARNCPASLSEFELEEWNKYRLNRINRLSLDYFGKLNEALSKKGLSERDRTILIDLKKYATRITSPTPACSGVIGEDFFNRVTI